jgi:hypothetical protein
VERSEDVGDRDGEEDRLEDIEQHHRTEREQPHHEDGEHPAATASE